MVFAIIAFSGSVTFLCGIVALFVFEAKRGVRVFESGRSTLDRYASYVYARTGAVQRSWRRETFRQTFHYFLHLALSFFSILFQWVSKQFDRLIRVNKMISRKSTGKKVKAVVEQKIDTPVATKEQTGHFVEIMKHKKRTALSDIEKKRKKEESIGMKL